MVEPSISKNISEPGILPAIEIVANEQDIYYHMAIDIFMTIYTNNINGKITSLILPVGPIGQYRIFADLANRYNLNLNNIYIFHMDEYLDSELKLISTTNPFSFRRVVEDNLYNVLKNKPPLQNIYFPDPQDFNLIWNKINELGGVDVCYGGVGYNGHIAFNEPEDGILNNDFLNLGTRVVKLENTTKIINSLLNDAETYETIPSYAVTIGLREIFAARSLKFYLFRPWQNKTLKYIIDKQIHSSFPASFLKLHENVAIIVTRSIAKFIII